MQFKTERKVGKTGVMLVGIGGNNGCTCVAGAIANKLKVTWDTKEGTHKANYWGSLLKGALFQYAHDYVFICILMLVRFTNMSPFMC